MSGFGGQLVSSGGGGTVTANQGTAGAQPWPVSVETRGIIKGTFTASASGANTVYTPTSGKSVQLLYFGYSSGANVSGCLAQLSLAGYAGGAAFDSQYLSAAGQPFARNIAAGQDYIQGSVNGALSVTLSAAQTVYVNYELVEV